VAPLCVVDPIATLAPIWAWPLKDPPALICIDHPILSPRVKFIPLKLFG